MSTETTEETVRSIGTIGNYYGGLQTKIAGGVCLWSVEDQAQGDVWEEIPRALFDELNKFEDARHKTEVAEAETAELERRAAARCGARPEARESLTCALPLHLQRH